MILAATVWVCVVPVALTTQPSVQYITSSVFGNYLVAPGQMISQPNVNLTLQTKSKCEFTVAILTTVSWIRNILISWPEYPSACKLTILSTTSSESRFRHSCGTE